MAKYEESRKRKAWKGATDLTATQEFLKQTYDSHYAERHRKVSDCGEADLINSYVPTKCPFCQSAKFRKFGSTKSGVQQRTPRKGAARLGFVRCFCAQNLRRFCRSFIAAKIPSYQCTCGKTFLPTTGTIFDEHRISISEWIESGSASPAFWAKWTTLGLLFRHVSVTADSWSNKNAFATSRYWLQKLFLTLENVQDGIVLSGDVWLDETFYRVRSEDVLRNEDGNRLPGLSRNQICIGVATNKTQTIILAEGFGKQSQTKTFETFRNHIEPGSKLIHDKEVTHRRLVKELSLSSATYSSKDSRGLPDKENPLNPVNRVHAILKKFLNAHSGFNRNAIQGYLNLFAFVSNPPTDMLEKVELVVKMGFENPKLLRYRNFYPTNTDVDEL